MISRRLSSIRRLFSIVPDFRSLYPDTREEFEYLRQNATDKARGIEKRYHKNEVAMFFSKSSLKHASTVKKKVGRTQPESLRKIQP